MHVNVEMDYKVPLVHLDYSMQKIKQRQIETLLG